MKNILLLTTECTVANGWGRYTKDLAGALRARAYQLQIIEGKHSTRGGALRILPGFIAYRANFFLAPWYAWRLRRYAQECDVIHVCVEPYAVIGQWLSWLSGKPYVVSAHGTYATMPYMLDWLRRWMHHHALLGAAAVVCVSEYTQCELEKRGIKNTTVVHNGIAESFLTDAPVSFAERENMILTVGALKPRKGQHLVIEALAEVVAKVPDARCVFVGSQTDKEHVRTLKETVARLGLERQVAFREDISDEELLQLYDTARVFAMPSVTGGGHFEGFGLVYIEANGRGLPVIGSQGSGATAAILDGETGYLVPQKDSPALAKRAVELLTDSAVWERLSARGVQWARQHEWKHVAKEYDRVYQSL